MANDSDPSGADIRSRFRQTDGQSTTDAAPTDQSQTGASIRQQFRDNDTAQSTTTPDDPYSIKHAWIQIPLLHTIGAGLTQGARDVVKSGADLATWVDQRVPALSWLDQHTVGDPAALQARLAQDQQQFESSPEGQSYTGQGARLAGQIVTTLPVAGPVGEAAGAAVNALARAAPYVGRVIPWLARTAAEGGAGGATFGALTEGGSNKPVGENIEENALLGAGLGPVASLGAKAVGAAGKGATGAYNYLTGKGPALEVEQALADARARSGISDVTPAPSTATPAEPASTPPVTPSAVPTAPEAAGAAPTSEAELAANAPSRSRELAGKVDALDKMISDRANVGRSDFTEYVKGNLPTQAEGLGDARLASIQRQVEPGDQRFTNFRDAAKDNRLEHFEKQSGTAEQLDAKEQEVADWDAKTLRPVWANKQPVDASGAEADVDARLASPTAQIAPVENALNEVRSRLFKRGTDELHTDPQMLYGARRQISYMLSRKGQLANPSYGDADVMRELIGVRNAIDKAIEPGAPGFQAWLAGHAERMRDVDRMDVLQGIRSKIMGANGEIQLSRLTTQLKALRTKMAQDGANPVHSLTLEDLEMLRDLNKDLLRENNRTLSMPVGSPTAHNLDVMTEHGLHAVNALAQAGAAHIPGGQYLLGAAQGRAAARNAARSKELWIQRLLEPPPAGSSGP